MTEQEIIENNKLIAEFMGYVPCRLFNDDSYIKAEWLERHNNNDTWDLPDGVKPYLSMPIQYNTSWGWLMPVVEKIESLGYIFQIWNSSAEYFKPFEAIMATNYDGETKIEGTYKAVIAFINYYNQTIK